LEADQHQAHPGNSNPRADVEMCGDPDYVMQQILAAPLDDASANIDIDCHVVTASYDPNAKSVVPVGITEEYHYIDSTAQLEYLIQDQTLLLTFLYCIHSHSMSI
jgi:hypothetical protein